MFTQTTWDKEGYAIREPGSTTYVGAIETAQDFDLRLHLEPANAVGSRAGKKVVIGDGAEWIWNIAEQTLPRRDSEGDVSYGRHRLEAGDYLDTPAPRVESGVFLNVFRFILTAAGLRRNI